MVIMITPIKLQNGLFAVPVPKESSKHYISATNYLCYKTESGYKELASFDPLKGNYEVLGEVTKLTILGFDYKKETGLGTFDFYELLSESGLHFENPYQQKQGKYWGDLETLNKWREAQNNLIEKLIILREI